VVLHTFYEKKVGTVSQLAKELGILDIDAGVRLLARYQSKQCYAFITRSPRGFIVMLYAIKSRDRSMVPDKRLLAKEFDDAAKALEFVTQVAAKPFRAFVY
jgi:hypothetical protein